MPDSKSRAEILTILLRKKPLDDDVSIETLSAMTENFSGGDIALLCRRAAVIALKRDMNNFVMRLADFESSLRGLKL